jgi:hypothetical protein
VQVVEHEHQRLPTSQHLEQLAHRAMGPEALVAGTRAGVRTPLGEAGEHVRELRTTRIVQRVELPRLEGLEVLVERIDEDPERQIPLQLGGGSGQDETALAIRTITELGEQACLPHARLPDDLKPGCAPTSKLTQRSLQRPELVGASDQHLSGGGHWKRSGGEHNPRAEGVPMPTIQSEMPRRPCG